MWKVLSESSESRDTGNISGSEGRVIEIDPLHSRPGEDTIEGSPVGTEVGKEGGFETWRRSRRGLAGPIGRLVRTVDLRSSGLPPGFRLLAIPSHSSKDTTTRGYKVPVERNDLLPEEHSMTVVVVELSTL